MNPLATPVLQDDHRKDAHPGLLKRLRGVVLDLVVRFQFARREAAGQAAAWVSPPMVSFDPRAWAAELDAAEGFAGELVAGLVPDFRPGSRSPLQDYAEFQTLLARFEVVTRPGAPPEAAEMFFDGLSLVEVSALFGVQSMRVGSVPHELAKIYQAAQKRNGDRGE